MRKIIFRGYAKTIGTDFAHADLYPADTPDSVLDEAAWEYAVENAQSFGWDLTDDPDDIENDENDDNYCTADEIGAYWEEYNGEKHDDERCGGGSFEEDFARQAERMN